MESMPKSVAVPSATPSKKFKKYVQPHTTTLGFMKPLPVFSREYIPKRDMIIDFKSFIRANPMPVPIFGKVKVHNRAFYIPFRCVCADFNNGIENTIFNYAGSDANIPSRTPIIQNNVLVEFFISTAGSSNALVNVVAGSEYDISVSLNGVSTRYTFTDLGLRYLSILYALGYKINWRGDDDFRLPALPLMCYAKVMIDWYYPSAYVGSSAYNYIDKIFRNAVYDLSLSIPQISALLEVCKYCSYENDYFVNAWDYPIGPNQGVERSLKVDDITNNSSVGQVVSNDPQYSQTSATVTPSNGTPFVGSNGSTSNTFNAYGVLTQYVVNALRSMTDFTLRHRLSGVRALDRYLTEYNVKLKDEILARSMYLGDNSQDIEFYDVFSNSDTYDPSTGNGARLGDYAGRGQCWLPNGSLKVTGMDEFGMVIIVNSLIPEVQYTQGLHREMQHVNYMDFYHGDFDHMVVQPISHREIFVSEYGGTQAATHMEDIFGFTAKYIEYNTPKSVESGLYLARTRRGLLPCYTLKRDLSYFNDLNAAQIKHSIGFVLSSDADQYNRIFNVDGKTIVEDQFNAMFVFEVTNYDSTLPPYQSFVFEHDNKETNVIEVNGSKVN